MLVVPVDQQEQKRVTVLEGVIGFANHEAVGLRLCNGSRGNIFGTHVNYWSNHLFLVIGTSGFTVSSQVELYRG